MSAHGAPSRSRRTRTGAVWVGFCVAALLLVSLVVFMLQNTADTEVTFLWLQGTAPLGLVLLVAALGAALVVLLAGSLRIVQLRRRGASDRAGAAADVALAGGSQS